jgi:cytochrome c oxidase cbb3-type subunit 3
MSAFWSTWIQGLVIFNMGITFFLFIFAIRTKIPTLEDGTTGHVWAHGVLREGLNKLPLWWIVGSAGWFLAAWIYLVLYPGFGRLPGVLGWSSHEQLEQQLADNAVRLEQTYGQFRAMPLERLALDEDAHRIGHRIFIDNCAACHGRNGAGNPGFPKLNDNFWTWGGSADDVLTTITNGRHGMMAPVGAALGEEGTLAVANYVASLSGIEHDAALVATGKEKFGTICVACHGPDAKGNPMLGAPDLTAGIFLRSVGVPGIVETIDKGRMGEMPAWSGRLNEDEIRLVAAWVIGNVNHDTKATAP